MDQNFAIILDDVVSLRTAGTTGDQVSKRKKKRGEKKINHLEATAETRVYISYILDCEIAKSGLTRCLRLRQAQN